MKFPVYGILTWYHLHQRSEEGITRYITSFDFLKVTISNRGTVRKGDTKWLGGSEDVNYKTEEMNTDIKLRTYSNKTYKDYVKHSSQVLVLDEC